ncbi:GNAT family N-acetyltransferase [Clostridium polynesiense]|uniref:GNAT family N-acetyltransferase n=1 Tax=Clostridium polynesiense TaxID=1325933 RepID=UPI001FA8069A|nr:GNAT family N-acetyltransferase [Clostridium polynesiense]
MNLAWGGTGMKICEYRLIDIGDVPAMVGLLACRQNLESKVFPFLKNSCLNTKYITDLLENIFVNSKAIGIGAFSNDELVGYILGKVKIDNGRGRHIWVPYEGVAIRKDQPSELIRNLYATVSLWWLEEGCFSHYALIPLGNQVYYEAFLQLSFFIQQVHGILNIEDYKPFKNVSDPDIRIANKKDSEAMGRMSNIICSYQNSAPVFEPALPEVVVKIKEGYKKIAEDDEAMIIIAEKDMKEIGFQVYEPITSDLMTPDDGIELSIAGTYPSQMRSGVGKKLMNEGSRIMEEKGYNNIIIDWRIANLASSTFWPKCGFSPIAYRMVRFIDSNFAWANFNNPSIKKL